MLDICTGTPTYRGTYILQLAYLHPIVEHNSANPRAWVRIAPYGLQAALRALTSPFVSWHTPSARCLFVFTKDSSDRTGSLFLFLLPSQPGAYNA